MKISLNVHFYMEFFIPTSGEMVQRSDWHKIVVFRPQLRDYIYNYMKKGQRVLVKGKIYYGEVKDEEGKPRFTASIIAEDIVMFQ